MGRAESSARCCGSSSRALGPRPRLKALAFSATKRNRYALFHGRLSFIAVSRAHAQARDEALLSWAGFEALVRAEQAGLLRIAWRFTHDTEAARDLVQSALTDAWERRGSLHDPALAASWLRRILVHRAINFHRRRRLWAAIEGWLRSSEDGVDSRAEEQLDRARLVAKVKSAVRTLPARQAAAFNLRYLEGLSLDEVADAMSIDPGTVRVHLYRALSRVKERVGLVEAPDEV